VGQVDCTPTSQEQNRSFWQKRAHSSDECYSTSVIFSHLDLNFHVI